MASIESVSTALKISEAVSQSQVKIVKGANEQKEAVMAILLSGIAEVGSYNSSGNKLLAVA